LGATYTANLFKCHFYTRICDRVRSSYFFLEENVVCGFCAIRLFNYNSEGKSESYAFLPNKTDAFLPLKNDLYPTMFVLRLRVCKKRSFVWFRAVYLGFDISLSQCMNSRFWKISFIFCTIFYALSGSWLIKKKRNLVRSHVRSFFGGRTLSQIV
jgi:hypothetical protein